MTFYSKGMNLTDETAIGNVFDCNPFGFGPGYVLRDGLWVHRTNGSWVSNGCVKLSEGDLDSLDVMFHSGLFSWGGSNGGSYSWTAEVQ
ncbi:MAG: hypothetical protein AB7H43_07295 [Acidimicrobiia bacterium]